MPPQKSLPLPPRRLPAPHALRFEVQAGFVPAWLALPRLARRKQAKELFDIVEKYKDRVRVSFYVGEALPDKDFTDFVLCRTQDLEAYSYQSYETNKLGLENERP